jgi:hypothetical protein
VGCEFCLEVQHGSVTAIRAKRFIGHAIKEYFSNVLSTNLFATGVSQ